MKKITNICFIIVSLMLVSSCAEVSNSNDSSTNPTNIISLSVKCSDLIGKNACESEAPRCVYDGKNCLNQSELLAKKAQETAILNKVDEEIKKTIFSPVIIKNDANAVANIDLNKISKEDFSKVSHIILPQADPLAKQFLENPFADNKLITAVRPLVWDKLLVLEKAHNNSALFKVEKDISNPTKKVVGEAKLTELFDDFKKPENLLGKGGQGSVYKVKYKDLDYALKINAQEYEDLEKLQFTGAVVKVFGAFNYDNKPCMLMEVGQKSLEDMNKTGEKLSDTQIKTAIINFKNLVEAQKKTQNNK